MGANPTNHPPGHPPGLAEVGLVIYPGAQLAALHGLTDLFEMANRVMLREALGLEPIRVSHWKLDEAHTSPRRVFASLPGESGALFSLTLLPTLDEPPSLEFAEPFLGWLRDAHETGVILSSVCAGAFLLAETGLLDGRPATTHWAHADTFRHRFPKIRMDIDRLLIDDGDLMTAGGLMAWTDLGLRLVERLRGPTAMIATARALLVDPPGREQRFYSQFTPPLGHGDRAVLKAQHRLQETHAKTLSVLSLAEHAGLEERTFLRRFRAATGLTTTQYVQRLRIARAQELLQKTSASVDQVAWDVGYADPGSFRKVFTRVTGLSPSAYRRRLSARAASS